MRTSVAFVQRRVPHYREAFFARLHEHLDNCGVSLDVIVGDPDAKRPQHGRRETPWMSTITGRRFAISGREIIWQDVLRATARHDLVITDFSPRIVSNLALIARSRLGGPLVAGFGHGRDFSSTRMPGPRSLNGRLVRAVDWWFAYNEISRQVVMSLGVPPRRITAIDNTIDTKRLGDAVAAHRLEGVAELRAALGIAGAPVAIFCGSLYAGKRLSFVFDAALRLRRRFPGLNLLVLGDGADQGEVRAFAAVHDWVHYIGRVVGDERAKYLAAADVMMMPGAVGLVVLDSFAARVPLVTTVSSSHGPEIHYLRHGENGWLSPNSPDAYVEAVALLLSDPALRERLQRGCAEAAERYPIEAMVTKFADGIRAALGEG